jgi:hypothetical protein
MPVVPCEIVTEPTVPGTSASHASDAIPKDCTPEKGGGCGGTPAGQQQKAAERRRAQQQQLHKYHSAESRWIDDIPEAPVFRPSAEEFADPLAYICKIQGEVSKWGICKIIPPVSAAVPGSTVLLEQGPYTFTTRQQVVRKPAVTSLDKLKFYASGKNYSIVNYEKTANEFSYRRYNMAGGLPSRFVEAEYWREWHGGNNLVVEYGNDVEGSAFSDEEWDPLASSRWNFKTLPVERDSILRHIPMAIPGKSPESHEHPYGAPLPLSFSSPGERSSRCAALLLSVTFHLRTRRCDCANALHWDVIFHLRLACGGSVHAFCELSSLRSSQDMVWCAREPRGRF